jgi:phospholipid transport system substrate-binding protein
MVATVNGEILSMRIGALARSVSRPLAATAAGLALTFGLWFGAASPTHAQAADPAIPTIDAFDKALLETMKSAGDLGVKGRYKKLEPVIEKAFNLPVMTRFAVGEKWTTYSDDEHQNLIDAFTRLTVASYAHNFDGYSGESFVINPAVQTRNQDKIVLTQLVRPKDKPVPLNYRMRLANGAWKVIDIYYQGNISQLTIRRNDLAATAMTGNAKALVRNLNTQADRLMH